MSTRRGIGAALIRPFVREAIRPYAISQFVDMLIVVMRHPAMLRYLDNAGSVGPDSVAGLRNHTGLTHTGLNENLARDWLDLHTLTPAMG